MRRQSISCQAVFLSIVNLLAVVSACMSSIAHAASATVATDTVLRAERYTDAASLSKLAKGTVVETLKLEAGWIQVRAGANVGWLRASQLAETSPATQTNKLEDGRKGSGNIMAISGVRSMPPASAQADTALSDIHAKRDINRNVSVTLRKQTLNIGKDVLDFSVTSSRDGYLYLIVQGSDNNSLYLLFPNELDQDNAIAAGKALKLPRKKWEIKVQGPSGTDKMLAVVTDSRRDLNQLGRRKAGPFLTVPTDAAGHLDLHWLSGASAKPASEECGHDKQKRNRNTDQKCSTAFGSMLIDIVEK